MSLGSYPLVYLPVAASLRTSDPGLEDVARSLGLGRVQTFVRVTLHQIRPALVGGSLLVSLILLAEFGTFEILRFQTFTTQIYTEFQIGFSSTTGAALSLVLVVLGLALLAGEALGRGRRRRPPAHTLRPHSGCSAAGRPVLAGLTALIGLAIGLLYALAYWFYEGTSSTLPPISILGAALDTAAYSAAAAALATAAAVPIALLVERHRSPASMTMERSTYIVQALPGIVVALSFVYFTIRYAPSLYLKSTELVAAYAMMFFPLALVAVRAGVAQAPGSRKWRGRWPPCPCSSA
jgi:iron(III) transport system permease protein